MTEPIHQNTNLHHQALSKQALPSNSIKKALNITEALNVPTRVCCSFAVCSDLFYGLALNKINLAICAVFYFTPG